MRILLTILVELQVLLLIRWLVQCAAEVYNDWRNEP